MRGGGVAPSRPRDTVAPGFGQRHSFDLRKVASYGDQDLERLLTTEGIIRNRLKLTASIANAQAALKSKLPSAPWTRICGILSMADR